MAGRHPDANQHPSRQLADARDAFIEAQRTLETAREHLLNVHTESARGWSTR